MKRVISGVVALVLLFGPVFAGAAFAEDKKVSVVTTIFPIYDWLRVIAGENGNVEVTMLMDNGVDLHSYQPSAADILKIATCDVFVFVGGESDRWVQDALAGAANPGREVVSLIGALGDDARAEETVEGMEHDADEDDGDEPDEHVWLSLRNARKLVGALAEALARTDPARADAYRANAEAYGEALSALDGAYADAVRDADFDTLLFADRFPFRYLTDDYGLKYYAAFAGCSAESEASFETVVFLAGKVDELGLTSVLTIEGGNRRIAETIVENTRAKDAKILTMNSMQSIAAGDVNDGATYLGLMEKNLEVLREALKR